MSQEASPEQVQRVVEVVRSLATLADLSSVLVGIRSFVAAETGAASCRILLHDGDGGELWSDEDTPRAGPVSRGLTGAVASHGATVALDDALNDPRYDVELDGPAHGPWLGVPVAHEGNVEAVVVVVGRRGDSFRPDDVVLVQLLARLCGPLLTRFALLDEATRALTASRRRSVGPEDLFRHGALASHFDRKVPADVVRVIPTWLSIIYPLCVVVLAAVLIASIVVSVGEYTEGPALLRSVHAVDVHAPVTGRIAEVVVEPGETVKSGQLLATYDLEDHQAEVDRARALFERATRSYLADPTDYDRAALVASARERLQAGEEALERRHIIAPVGGRVSEAHLAIGEQVAAGVPLFTVHPLGDALDVVAVIPARDRPMLDDAHELRFELEGHERVRVDLIIDERGVDALGPEELERVLGPTAAGLSLTEPGVLVRARLLRSTFREDGRRYRFRSGMTGLARVRIGSRSVLATVFPMVERVLEGRDEPF